MSDFAVSFRVMRDGTHLRDLALMMRALYAEDPPEKPIKPRAFERTARFLMANPAGGRIVLMMRSRQPVGYALLIPYWSNEFGGTLLFIDELFVVPEHRGLGIATRMLNRLIRRPPFKAVALALEVTPGNRRAQRLYASLGFVRRKNQMLTRRRT
jgi:GNAT superfamily N-acetyltransferase